MCYFAGADMANSCFHLLELMENDKSRMRNMGQKFAAIACVSELRAGSMSTNAAVAGKAFAVFAIAETTLAFLVKETVMRSDF